MFVGSRWVLRLLPCACLALGTPAASAPPQATLAVERPADLLRQASELGRARRFPEAIALAERAVAGYSTADPEGQLADALSMLGGLSFQAQDFKRAEIAFQRELALRERTAGDRDIAYSRTLGELANAKRGLGELVEAKELLQQALAIQRRLLMRNDLALPEAQINLGSLLDALGDRPGAEALLVEAVGIFDTRPEGELTGGMLATKAVALNNLALLYFRAGEFDRAETPFRRSLELRERLSTNPASDPVVARATANLAALYQERGQFDQADPLYRRVLDIYGAMSSPPPTTVASTLNNFAMIQMLRGRHAEADAAYTRALTIREAVLGNRHPDVARTLETIAIFDQVAGRLEAAFRAMERSTAIHEDNLRTILMSGSDQQRQGYMTTVQENLDIALSLRAAALGQHADAASWAATLVMRRKGRVLDAAATMTERLAARMTGDERQLFDKLAAARTQLAALVLQSTDAPAGQRDEARRRLEAEIDETESALATRSRDFAAELRPIDVDAVRAQLPARTVLVEYVRYRPFNPKAIGRNNRFGQPRYAAFVISRDRAPHWFELGAAAPIERGIGRFRDMLRVPSSPNRAQTRGIQAASAAGVRTTGRDLGRLLLDPMQAELAGADRILFAPDGELSVIPFAALQMSTGPPGGAAVRFLIERAEIGYLTSGRDLVSRAERSNTSEAPLIVAAPAFDVTPAGANVTFKPLAGTAEEADALLGLIAGARVLTGAMATERAVKAVRGPRLLHVATHGFFLNAASAAAAPAGERGGIALAAVDSQSVGRQALLRSGLAFAGANQRQGGDGEDGLLTALEAASLDLRGTQLVVLSACDTGLGEVRSGDGVYGLRRALTIAGAESQVMSLWQVSDRATRDLMIAYYRQLAAGAGRAAALRTVQLDLLKSRDWSHPYYWAAFVLAGAWEPLRTS